MNLRFQSLVSILEANSFVRKSLDGFKTDFPEKFSELKEFYLSVEAFGLLNLLVNNSSTIDSRYMIYVKNKELPQIIEIKESYSKTEYLVISRKTKIELSSFEEIITSTN